MKEDNFREGGRWKVEGGRWKVEVLYVIPHLLRDLEISRSRNKYGMTFEQTIKAYFSSKVPSACFANLPLVGPWCLSDLSQGHPPN